MNIVASMVFAGISGTAIADVCSLGGMLIPAMVEDGYDDDFSGCSYGCFLCGRPHHPAQCAHGHCRFPA